MTGNTYLTCQYAVAAYFCTTGYPHLGTKNGTLPYLHIVSYLTEVVNLGILAHTRFAHHGTVNSGIGTNLHIIFNNHIAYLWYFLVHTLCIRFKTESVSPDYGTCMENTILPDNAVIIDFCTGIQHGIIAYPNIIPHITLRIDLHTFPDLCAFSDVSTGTDVNIIRQLNTFADECALLNTFLDRVHGFGNQRKQLSHRGSGILHKNERGTGFPLKRYGCCHQHYRGLCGWQIFYIFLIAEETQIAGLGILQTCHIADCLIAVSTELTAQKGTDLLCGKFHYVLN